MRGRIVGRLGTMEDPMKRLAVFFGVVVLSYVAAAIPARAQSHELLQGTQVHLRLLTDLSTAVAKSGDPFIAESPSRLHRQPDDFAGRSTRKGNRGGIIHPRLFSIFRGQAAMIFRFATSKLTAAYFPRE